MKKILTCLALSVLSVLPASADTLAITNTFTANTPARAAQVNQNFTDVKTWANGNITDTNVKSSAAINPVKLDLTLEYGPILRAAASDCLAVGNTGDTVPRWKATSDGKVFLGAGGASAVDLCVKRESAGVWSVRNGSDNAYADAKVANFTASGSIAGGSLSLTGSISSLGSALAPGQGGLGQTNVPTNGQIPIGNGTGFALALPTSSDSSITITGGSGSLDLKTSLVQTISGTVSSASLKTLIATPVTIIAAQGAGKMIDVVRFCAKYVYGGTAYTSATGTIQLGYNTTAMRAIFDNTHMTGVANVYTGDVVPYNNISGITVENVPVTLLNTGANEFATGNGTIEYSILYRIVSY